MANSDQKSQKTLVLTWVQGLGCVTITDSEFQSPLLLSKKPMDSELDCYSKWRFTGDVRTWWSACLEAHTTLAK